MHSFHFFRMSTGKLPADSFYFGCASLSISYSNPRTCLSITNNAPSLECTLRNRFHFQLNQQKYQQQKMSEFFLLISLFLVFFIAVQYFLRINTIVRATVWNDRVLNVDGDGGFLLPSAYRLMRRKKSIFFFFWISIFEKKPNRYSKWESYERRKR